MDKVDNVAISEFPKWRKYLISLSFRDKSSVRPVQVGGFEANIVVHRSTAVRGRGGPPPPWESSCRTRTGPVEADGTVDAQNAPTAPWKTLRVFHELPQGLSHRITHAKPRKAPKWRWETRIDPIKRMFRWFHEEKSIIWIKSQLDKDDILARRGKLFTTGSITVLLQNTHHIGHYDFKDKKSADHRLLLPCHRG